MKCIHFVFLTMSVAGLARAQAPAIFDGGIVNAASFQKGPQAPGSLITIFGSQLASRTAQADTIPLSTSLGGATVTFVSDSATRTAPLLFTAPDDPSRQITSQINAQVPWDLIPAGSTGTVNVIVDRDGTSSAPTPLVVGPPSPGIFASGGRAIAVNGDGTLAWPAGVIAGLNTHGAKPGDAIVIYATGLGAVNSPPANGQSSLDKLRSTVTTPVVMIGGVQAQVLFSGLSPQFVGVNQLNVVVPNAAVSDSAPLQIQMGGVTTSASITMAVTR